MIDIVSLTLDQTRALPSLEALPPFPGLQRTGNYELTRDDFLVPIGGCQHIAVTPEDNDGPDSSAEAVTGWGLNPANTAASWQDCVDRDTWCPLLPITVRPWQQGKAGDGIDWNEALVGQEMGIWGTDWATKPAWAVAEQLQMSAAVWAVYFSRFDWPLIVTLDRARLVELVRRRESPGLTGHYVIDPQNRSDPGLARGIDTFPWDRLLQLIHSEKSIRAATHPPQPKEAPTVARREPTHADMLVIERDFRRRGLSIYCGPSDWAAGRCRPGLHGHDADSMHFQGRAIDFGYGTAPINDLEALIVEVVLERTPSWYPTLALRPLWNRGPGDHDDHGHIDAKGLTWRTDIRPRRGVRARDGVDLFVPLSVIPEHVPPINGTLTLRQVADAQQLLKQAGLYAGVVDGYRGTRTAEAATKAQQMLGLDPDGYPGAGTLAALRKHLAGPDYSSFTRADIEAAQRLLKDAGWYVGADTAIDGSPGPRFQAAMKVAQDTLAKAGLYTDEIDLLPGPNFMAALRAWLAPKPAPTPTPPAPAPTPAPAPRPVPVPEPAPEVPVLDELGIDALLASIRLTRVKE